MSNCFLPCYKSDLQEQEYFMNKSKVCFLISVLFFWSFASYSANLPALKEGQDVHVDSAISMANSVITVKTLKIGKYAYKLVMMDSGLNGDIFLTNLLLVGEGSVGSLAGFEAAFLLSTSASSLDVKKSGDYLEVRQREDLDGKYSVARYKFDPESKSLVRMN